MTTNIFLHMKVYLSLYKMMYNNDVCCHYIRRYIMTTNISVIHENVFLIIQDNV